MLKGSFKRYHHDHYFETRDGGTAMTDIMQFEAPTILARLVEEALEPHFRQFLIDRNEHIQRIAESNDWKRFLPTELQPTK
jgi:ligand-binding SRPBCC domain-containing protein